MSKKVPKVFVSYSHDDADHKQWVAKLSVKLMDNGVDTTLDQWDLYPGGDVPKFMEESLTACDYALLVCTKRYVDKANKGDGGVGYEKMIVSAEMIKDMDAGKFIPLIRQSGTAIVPTFISSKLYIDFSDDEYFEAAFDELLRSIFKDALSKKPPLGERPEVAIINEDVSDTSNLLDDISMSVFKQMVAHYNKGEITYFMPSDFASLFDVGRIKSEAAMASLLTKKLVSRDRDGDYVITEAGKVFAVQKGFA